MNRPGTYFNYVETERFNHTSLNAMGYIPSSPFVLLTLFLPVLIFNTVNIIADLLTRASLFLYNTHSCSSFSGEF